MRRPPDSTVESTFTPRPKPQRREYYDTSPGRELAADRAPSRGVAGRRPTVEDAVHAMLASHRVDWSGTTQRNAEHYLLKGRWPEYLVHRGIVHIDQLTGDSLADFMSAHAGVLSPATLVKFRSYFRALAKFCADRSGYGASELGDATALPKPIVPKRKLPMSLSRAEEGRVVAAARPGRDRLIVQTLLATGLRVSELCALTLDHLDDVRGRPPRLRIVGTVHNPVLTKGKRDRVVGFRDTYRALPQELLAWASKERAITHDRAVFVADDGRGLTTSGVEQLMQRVGEKAGVRCNPHRLRHTWATRCADAGMPIFHLQLLGGWESVEMARRYYTASDLEAIASLDRFRC